MKNNIAFDNGINGLVVHKTTNEDVTVNVEENIIFYNGKTSKEKECRQSAGGLTVNSGSTTIDSNVKLFKNEVTANELPDRTY